MPRLPTSDYYRLMERKSSPEMSCPRCRSSMRSVRSVPSVGAHPELVTFQCGACDHVETIEHDPPRPSV